MSDFYYCISGSNDDIICVQDNMWSWMSTGMLGPEPGFTGSFASKSIEDYSPVWDEAKRCTYDTDKNPRYRYAGSTIQPKSNVQNIDYDSGSMDINDDGTLTWK
jgi:hypothetical protein